MYESDQKIPKYEIEVQIDLDNGTQLLGYLFVKQMQRLSDLLNDQRLYLPFRTSDGTIAHLRKESIAKVAQLKQQNEHNVATDPFEILGVEPNISDEELKHTFHDLCTNYHPDTLHCLDLPSDLFDFANSRLIRIIDAYRRIKTIRHRANGNGRSNPCSAGPVFA
jgi:DnaJ like chaperone protein